METPVKTFCFSHYRHLRLLFFVDKGASADFLINLFTDNYQLWGGRYNPVIPVEDGVISLYYQSQLSNYDPDIIFYSENIGLENAKQFSQQLHPHEFIQLDPTGRNNLPGVHTRHLLSEGRRQAHYFARNFSLVYFQHHEVEPQTSFYSLNFGIRNQYVEDITLAHGYPMRILDITNIAETNRQLAEQRPFYNVLFSELHVETTLLRPSNEWELNCFELIIYDQARPFDDLLYFWNRQRHQRPENRIRQVIISRKQFALFLDNTNFGALLHSLTGDNNVYLHSLSIEGAELEQLRERLHQAYPFVRFRIPSSRSYPRAMSAETFPHIRNARKSKNLLLGKKDYLKLPSPVWSPDSTELKGTYAYDIELFQEDNQRINYLKLPYGTVTNFLLCNHPARVNKAHHTSFFMTAETQGLDISIPNAMDIFQSRLRARSEHGELINLPVQYLRPSDAGRKIAAFVRLFDQRIDSAVDLIHERFWIDLILGISTASKKKNFEFRRTKETVDGTVEERFHEKVGKSNIHNHDGTFSYEDLQAERRLIYLEHKDQIRKWLQEYEPQLDDDRLVRFMQTSAGEDFQTHIDPYLQYLVDRDILFIGMKVKCPHCGSNAWYALAELKNKLSCKGCQQRIIPSVKSNLYYRFSDVIYNNISNDAIKRAKAYHGNCIVLRTLGYFQQHHDSLHSFHWFTCMDVGIRAGNQVKETDIDILILQHGTLILGEAKANAGDFNRDQFDKLKLMAETLRPDKIILAYMQGHLNEARIDKLRNDLARIGCEAILHRVTAPDYFFGRLGQTHASGLE